MAKRNLKAKGQAFIVFESVESAAKAIEEVQGFEIFGKEMVLQFAKSRSDAFVKRGVEQGEWGEEEFEGHKRRRVAEKGMFYSPRGFCASLVCYSRGWASWVLGWIGLDSHLLHMVWIHKFKS